MNLPKTNLKLPAFLSLVFLCGCGTTDLASAENADDTNSSAQKGVISGLCRNAYNPISANVERKYRVTANGLPTSEMTETYRSIAADSFVVHADYARDNQSQVKTDLKWICTAQGLTPSEFDANTLQTKNGVSGKYETLKVSGVTIPAEARWRTGEKWNATYDVKYTMQIPNSQVRADASGNIVGDGEIIGEESVTVPAGTFKAFKVRTVTKMNMTVKVSGATMPMPNQMSLETMTWFAKGVGKVKSVSSLNGASVGSTELLSTNAR